MLPASVHTSDVSTAKLLRALLSTMVSFAPGAQSISLDGLLGRGAENFLDEFSGVISMGAETLDVLYLNLVLCNEVGIALNVGEGLAPTSLASEAKRTEDRGIFKAKRTA